MWLVCFVVVFKTVTFATSDSEGNKSASDSEQNDSRYLLVSDTERETLHKQVQTAGR